MSVETDITLIVKTFERPRCVQRLIASIKQYYPDIRVVVVDDSEHPTEIPGVEYHILPFATGISIGRNLAVSKVKTAYFMTLDDDFIFTLNTNLQIRYDILENTDIDIVGTNVSDNQNRKGMLTCIKNGVFYRWNASKGKSFDYPLHDYVPQCFMARTEKFKQAGGWDNDFLVWDHEALFLRIRGKLKITMLPIVDILHKPASNPVYKDYRWGSRLRQDRLRLNTKYGICRSELLKVPPGWKKEV